MSLINSVLRDLDKRRADASGVVPNEVRPLPEGRKEFPARAVGLVAVLSAVVAGAWLALPVSTEAPPAVPAVASVPAVPAVAPAPAAVTAAPAVPPAPTSGPVLPVPPALGALRLEDSLERLPAAPPREKAKETGKTEKARAEPKPEPRPEPKAEPRPAPVIAPEPAPVPKPAKPIVEDDWTRAQTLLRENRSAEAEPLLRQLLQKTPGHISARQALIGLLLPARRHAEAIEVLREGQALTPEQTGWAMNLARLQADRNDYAAAWETLSRSLPHAQQQADFLAFCGTVLQRLNRAAEAVTYYQGALRIKPQEGRWWVGLGMALEAERKPAEARDAYQRARASGTLTAELAGFVDQKLR